MARKRGGQTKLTHQIQTIITEAVEKGVTLKRAAALAGIGESTLHTWVQRGEQGDPSFAGFAEALTRARGRCEEQLVDLIQIAALDPKNWKAASWILERRYPEEWGETVKHHVQQEVARELGHFLAACRDQLPPDVWEQVKSVAERMGDGAGDGGAPGAAQGH